MPRASSNPTTLSQHLAARAELTPDATAFEFVDRRGRVRQRLTFGQLHRRALAIAAVVRAQARPGECVLVTHSPGLGFVEAFFGCLFAGTVAVPSYPPDPARLHRTLPRLDHIMRDCGARLVLTDQRLLRALQLIDLRGRTARRVSSLRLPRWLSPRWVERYASQAVSALSEGRWIATDTIADREGRGHTPWLGAPDELAYLQYTSGSTSAPRGVRITHANTLANLDACVEMAHLTPGSRGVSWVPVYHDLGLVCFVLGCPVVGFSVRMMSPMDFLLRPSLWLEQVSEVSGTHIAAPNFGYDLCVRKTTAEARAALDLSHVITAGNGGETVRADTLDRFCDAFAPAGFSRSAFVPCLGMAEATLFVACGKPRERESTVLAVEPDALAEDRVVPVGAGGTRVVGHGVVARAHEVAIVEPQRLTRLPEGHVGEIWFCGPSVCEGYWGQDDPRFCAVLAGDGRRWLRTGDLGFVHAGELFVTGRLKDLIILRGRNYYPQDIELSVEHAHAAVRPGGVAAFAQQHEGHEVLAVVAELDPVKLRGAGASVEAVREQIRASIEERNELSLARLVFIAPRTLPKTSSGKVQRRRCRSLLERGQLEVLEEIRYDVPSPTTKPRLRGPLVERLAPLFGSWADAIDAQTDLRALGLDSLASANLVVEIRTSFGVDLPLELFATFETVAELAAWIEQADPAAPRAGEPTIDAPPLEAERERVFDATPIQELYWSVRRSIPGSYRMFVALDLEGPLDREALESSWRETFGRHELLGSMFVAEDDSLRVHTTRTPAPPIEWEELADPSAADDRLGEAIRRPFELHRPPLGRVHVLRVAPQRFALLLNCHHVTGDLSSFGWVLSDLLAAYARACGSASWPQSTVEPPERLLDFESRRAAGGVGEAGRAWWTETLADAPLHLFAPPALDAMLVGTAPRTIEPAVGAALQDRCAAFAVSLASVTLAAFAQVVAAYVEREQLVIASPASTRLPGAPFVSAPAIRYLPYRLQPGLHQNPLAWVEHTAAVMRQALDHREHAPCFGALRPRTELERQPLPDVHHHYYDVARSNVPDALARLLGGGALELAGLRVRQRPLNELHTRSPVGLGLMVIRRDEGLTLWVDRRSDVVPSQDAERLVDETVGWLERWARG